MEYTTYKDLFNGSLYKARIVDELPTVEKLDYTCGHDQIIRCAHMTWVMDPITRDSGWYDFYLVTKFCGSQCDDPDGFERNSETYAIAVWVEYDPEAEEDEE